MRTVPFARARPATLLLLLDATTLLLLDAKCPGQIQGAEALADEEHLVRCDLPAREEAGNVGSGG